MIYYVEAIAGVFAFMKVASICYEIGKEIFGRLRKMEVVNHERSVLKTAPTARHNTSLRNSIIDSFDFGGHNNSLNRTDQSIGQENGEEIRNQSHNNVSFDDSILCNSKLGSNLKNFVKSSPQSILSPIHTKEQLNALLAEDRSKQTLRGTNVDRRFFYLNRGQRGSPSESPFETSISSANLHETGGASLNISADGRIYMVSPNAEVRGDNNEKLDFRAQLNESRGSSSGRRASVNRRRRSVSPDQPSTLTAQADALGTPDDFTEDQITMLNETQMNLCEPRLRIWIVRTILEPILKAVNETNKELTTSFAGLHLRVGVSTLEALRLALKMNNRLGTTKLPFLLSFLEIDENQAYLLARITQLAADPFMENYKWNSGGYIPLNDDSSVTTRYLPQVWQPPLPSDAQLIFKLFTAYMDMMISTSSFASSRLNRPFASRYILDTKDNRLQASQAILAEYYFKMTTASPPHFDFIIAPDKGRLIRLPISPGEHNLFRCILSFVNHVKVYYDSTISLVEMGRTGINLECVINVD